MKFLVLSLLAAAAAQARYFPESYCRIPANCNYDGDLERVVCEAGSYGRRDRYRSGSDGYGTFDVDAATGDMTYLNPRPVFQSYRSRHDAADAEEEYDALVKDVIWVGDQYKKQQKPEKYEVEGYVSSRTRNSAFRHPGFYARYGRHYRSYKGY